MLPRALPSIPDRDIELIGVDFTCAPGRVKPIVAARGRIDAGLLKMRGWTICADWPAFDALLAQPGPWLGGFDLPFGLPRQLIHALGWPADWHEAMRIYGATSRDELRARFKAFCAARPAGGKFAHRATDAPAGSSPSMKWVNPPVAWMMHAGVPRLIAAGVGLPGLHEGAPDRIALEAYPGLVARAVVGHRSYKSDRADLVRDGPRRATRLAIVQALERAGVAGLMPVVLPRVHRAAVLDDGRGDRLDALLCLAQAAWACARRAERFGLPAHVDPLEGWIVGAGEIGVSARAAAAASSTA